MIGTIYTIKMHEATTGEVVFDGVDVTQFNHTSAHSAVTTQVYKEDMYGTVDNKDKWVVKVLYPEGEEPDGTVTVGDMLETATDAIEAAYTGEVTTA